MTEKNQESKQKNNKKQSQKPQKPAAVADNTSFDLSFKWQDIEPVYKKVLKNAAKNVKLPGFRKGQAPSKLAEEKIGLDHLFEHTLQQVLPEKYIKKIEADKLKPLTQPEFKPVKLKKGEDWIIKAIFAQKPEIDVKGYKKTVKKAKKEAEKTLDEMKKEIEKKAKDQAKKNKDKKDKEDKKKKPIEITDKQKKDVTIQTIFKHLVEKLEPKIPELLIKQNTRRELRNLQDRLKQLNIEFEDYLKSQKISFDQLASRMSFNSLSQLQVEFLIDAIAQKEEIKAEEKDVQERLEKIEDEQMRKRMKKDKGYQNYLKSLIIKEKVMDHLLDL